MMQTYAYDRAYELEVFMRTTLKIEEELIHKAEEMTGIHEKTHLVKLGLEALIARESSKRLAKLGGTERNLRRIPRRRAMVGTNGFR
jgi:Arc/MetJ family transcription regulator